MKKICAALALSVVSLAVVLPAHAGRGDPPSPGQNCKYVEVCVSVGSLVICGTVKVCS